MLDEFADGECARLTNEIAILEVEAIQLIASLFGIHHILIDDKCRSLCVIGNPLAYLSMTSVNNTSCTMLRSIWGRTYRMGPNLPKRSNNSSTVTL
jgi:hypothetical protein